MFYEIKVCKHCDVTIKRAIKLIKHAKRTYNDNIYRMSTNKPKTAWNLKKGSFSSVVNNLLMQVEVE